MSDTLLPILFLLIFLAGCSHTSIVQSSSDSHTTPPDYSLIIYIHGDSNYLYHTNDGKELYADENALYKAKSVAENASSGSVIIFHRQPERPFLGIFPRRTSQLYVYRNGEQQLSAEYRKDGHDESFMHEENLLFQQYALQENLVSKNSFFFYFGHEIPQRTVSGYHKSDKNDKWGTQLFAEEVKTFLPPGSDRFGIIGLSTCNNGTPEMANLLKPVASVLLASPGNLHLSHVDFEKFSLLENGDQYIKNPNILAENIASDTFSRLSNQLLTEVTLSIYNLQADGLSLDSLNTAANTYSQENLLNYSKDNIDCADVLPINGIQNISGVTTFYQPPRFGNGSNADAHSGWGCKPTQ